MPCHDPNIVWAIQYMCLKNWIPLVIYLQKVSVLMTFLLYIIEYMEYTFIGIRFEIIPRRLYQNSDIVL